MRTVEIPWYCANAEDPSALEQIESGWDDCPGCGGLACVLESNPLDEYLAQCPNPGCELRYVVVIP